MKNHLILGVALSGLWLGPANGEGIPKPTLDPIGKAPAPTGVFTPGKPPLVDPHVLEAVNAQPTTALSDITGLAMPDQGTRLSWTAARAGELDVRVGDTFELAYLTRGKPAYDHVKLQFSTDTDQLDLGAACGDLAEKHIATVDGQIKAEPAVDDLTKLIITPKTKLDGKGDVFLVHVTAAFNADLLAAAKPYKAEPKKQAAVRAFPVDAKGTCLQGAAGAYLATLVDKASIPQVKVVLPPPPPPEPPHVGVRWEVVGYSPRIINWGRCDYIIVDTVSDPTWKAVLQAANFSTAVGTHFGLCEGDFHRLYDELPASAKIGIALQDALSELTHAYNWTTGEFQKLAADLAGPASAILHSKKFGLMVTEGLLGALPGSPLTGDLDMVVDQGCAYLKQQVGDKLASEQNIKSLPDGQKKQSDDAVQQVCDAVKNQLQDRGRPNKFLIHDPALEPRAPIMYLRIKYSAVNNPPAGAVSEPISITLDATSRGGPGPDSPFGAPQIMLLKRDIVIPPGKAGTIIVAPFLMNYVVPADSEPMYDSGEAKRGIDLNAGGQTLVLKDIRASIAPPAQ